MCFATNKLDSQMAKDSKKTKRNNENIVENNLFMMQ